MSDLVSVIINVYNGEKYIAKCVESIITQTYKNLEILIINDGSIDNTLDICESYKDKRIKIVNQKNVGLSNARNIGIEEAKGEYLYFVDSDDWIQNDTIEYLYNLCKKYNTKMSTCKPIDVYNYNTKIVNKREKVKVISSKEMLKKILLSVDRSVTIWNKLIKKELFNNIRFEDRITNDVAVTYKLALASENIAYGNQIKYYYLRHKESITISKKNDSARLIDKYNVCFERYSYLKKLYPNLPENDIGMIRIIPMLYIGGSEKICNFLDNQGGTKLFKKLFSLKVLTSKLKPGEKIKILLFRLSPQLDNFIYRKYLKAKCKKQNK